MREILLIVVTGAIFGFSMDWAYRFWRSSQERQRRSKARAILKSHRLSPRLYHASIGTKDGDLQRALDEFASTGHVIVDDKGIIVGRISSRMVAY